MEDIEKYWENETIDVHAKTSKIEESKNVTAEKAAVQENLSLNQSEPVKTETDDKKSVSDENKCDETSSNHQIEDVDNNVLTQDLDPGVDAARIDTNEEVSTINVPRKDKKDKLRKRIGKNNERVPTCTTIRSGGNSSNCKICTVALLTYVIMTIIYESLTNKHLKKVSETIEWLFCIDFELLYDITACAVPYRPENVALHMWDSTEILIKILQDAFQRRVHLEKEQFRLATFCLHSGLSFVSNILELAKSGFYFNLDGRIMCYNCNSVYNTELTDADNHGLNCHAQENTSETIADNYGASAPRTLVQETRNRTQDRDDNHSSRLSLRLGQTINEREATQGIPIQPASVCFESRGTQESEVSTGGNLPVPVNVHENVVFDTYHQLTPSNQGFPLSCTRPRDISANTTNLVISRRESSTGPTFVPDPCTYEETQGCVTQSISQSSNQAVTNGQNLDSKANSSNLNTRSYSNLHQQNSSITKEAISNGKSRTDSTAAESPNTYTTHTSHNAARTLGNPTTALENTFEDLARSRSRTAKNTFQKCLARPPETSVSNDCRPNREISAKTRTRKAQVSETNSQAYCSEVGALKDDIEEGKDDREAFISGDLNLQKSNSGSKDLATRRTQRKSKSPTIHGNDANTLQSTANGKLRQGCKANENFETGLLKNNKEQTLERACVSLADKKVNRTHVTTVTSHPEFASCNKREETFLTGEGLQSFKYSGRQMAKAGQFYTGQGDRTCCYECGKYLQDWKQSDNPAEEHAKYFPECPLSKMWQKTNTEADISDTSESENENM